MLQIFIGAVHTADTDHIVLDMQLKLSTKSAQISISCLGRDQAGISE